jgi:hypothetical protein
VCASKGRRTARTAENDLWGAGWWFGGYLSLFDRLGIVAGGLTGSWGCVFTCTLGLPVGHKSQSNSPTTSSHASLCCCSISLGRSGRVVISGVIVSGQVNLPARDKRAHQRHGCFFSFPIWSIANNCSLSNRLPVPQWEVCLSALSAQDFSCMHGDLSLLLTAVPEHQPLLGAGAQFRNDVTV